MSGFSRSAALSAANHTSRATSELLRYGTEGDGLPGHPFGMQDPTVELAKALIASALIESEGIKAIHGTHWSAEVSALAELVGACRKFVGDWTDGASKGPFFTADNAVGATLPQDRKVLFPNPSQPSRPSPRAR